jgi:hypothetical protein
VPTYTSAPTDRAPHKYPDPLTVPDLYIRTVTTGGIFTTPIMDPVTAPQWLRNELTHWVADEPRSVLVLDLGDARWEAETLLQLLTTAANAVRDAAEGDVVMVVSTTQPSVAQIARMISTYMEVPLYIADSPSTKSVAKSAPAGRLTTTERATLTLLAEMGGRVTASDFAAHAALEVTAAGNRLGNLAKRGYVNRVSRSRREGDVFVSPAWFGTVS